MTIVELIFIFDVRKAKLSSMGQKMFKTQNVTTKRRIRPAIYSVDGGQKMALKRNGDNILEQKAADEAPKPAHISINKQTDGKEFFKLLVSTCPEENFD